MSFIFLFFYILLYFILQCCVGFCHTSTFLVFCILSKFWNLLVIFHTPWKISVRVFWLRLDLIYTEIWEWLTLTILVLSIHWHNFYCCLVTKLCPTVLRPMDCSLPGSFVHGISQARILEWVAMPSSRASSWPRYWTHFCTGRQILYYWAIWEASDIIHPSIELGLEFLSEVLSTFYIFPKHFIYFFLCY